ncbi:MAG: MATE family efflux transporter [Bacteroidetes bacterium]|nr:MATE family efflux transporter [Bacteroidota bacterium]
MTTTTSYQQKAKEALTLSMPIIAGQLGQVLMGFFDTVQIGGLGHEYIAASGFANGLYWMIILLGMGILYAVSPLVSKAFGEQKAYRSIGVLQASLLVSVVLTFIFTGLIHLMATHIEILKHTEVDNRLGAAFLNTVNYSTGFVFFFMAGKQFLDGMGHTKVGMYITLVGLVLNYFLNDTLIYGKYGMPAWGIEGAAMANSISRGLMAVAIFVYIWRNQQVAALWQTYRAHRENPIDFVKPILVIGVPAGLQFFWEVAAFNAGQIMSGWISVEAEAAHMIAIGLASITFMVLSGVAHAGTIMVGYSFGAKNKEEIRRSGQVILLITLSIEIIFAVLFFAFRHQLPEIYTQESSVIGIASTMLVFAALFQLSDGMQAAGAGLLRGMHDVKYPAAIAFVCYWLVMIPTGYVLAFTFGLGLRGIWIGFLVGLTLAAVAMLLRFNRAVQRLPF